MDGRSSRIGRKLEIWVLLPLCLSAHAGTIKLNEMMSSNLMTIEDEDGDSSDWIELYNEGPDTVFLLGYGLSDEEDNPFKWTFPDVPLPQRGFLLVFASGKDRASWPGELHANFRIRADGELLLLTAPDAAQADVLEPVPLDSDISYGRVPDGGDGWWFFENPTPGESNGSDPPTQRAPPPIFLLPSGFYPAGIWVALSCEDPAAVIRFTLDGSPPTDTSSVYTDPMILATVTVVRAATWCQGMLPSKPVNVTYIVGYDTSLPVVSLITHPDNLWSDECGIYVEGPNAAPQQPHIGANYWQDWEIPVHFQFLDETGQFAHSMDVGMAIHGGWTRTLPQKSLRITARDEFGSDRIRYPLFPSEPISSFKALILRNSGNDWASTMMRDVLMTGLTKGAEIGIQAYRPVVVFLNGEYWGIHNLRERLSEFYLAAHYGVAKDSVDLIENNRRVNAGDMEAFAALTALVESNDLSDSSAYDSVRTMMDIEDFIRYQAVEIYLANKDWPANNIKCWHPRGPDGRFRWLLYDTDNGFCLHGSVDHNTLEYATAVDSDHWANPPHATLLLRKLLDNSRFRQDFIVRFCDLMNSFFAADRVLGHINRLRDGIADEMPSHEARWYPDHDWESQLETLRQFAVLRKGYVLDHLRAKFDLAGTLTLTVDRSPDQGGRVRVNPFFLDGYPWRGQYFSGLPIELHAEPFAGYRFMAWAGDTVATQQTMVIRPITNTRIQALFEPTSIPDCGIAITEINYHSADDWDTGDWVELFAYSGSQDLGGWMLQDRNDDHCFFFPWGTILHEGHHLVLASDRESFTALFPEVNSVIGDIGFDLGNTPTRISAFGPTLFPIRWLTCGQRYLLHPRGDSREAESSTPSHPHQMIHSTRDYTFQ